VRAPICTAALAFALLASPTLAAAPLEIGVQDDGTFAGLPGNGPTPRRVKAAYKATRRLHARVQKVNLLWKWVAHRADGPEVYDWSFYDRVIDAAIDRHLEPQVTLTGPAPSWDTGDHRTGVYRPSSSAFGRFAAGAATHYRDRVQRWAIWNEPNWPTWLAPTRHAAAIYRRLYRAGWTAVKRVDPTALVLFGELAPMGPPEAAIPPLRFLRRVTCRNRDFKPTRRCGTLRTDGFAHHPYTLRWRPDYMGPGPDDVTMGSLGRLRFVLRQLAAVGALETPGGDAPDLYLTEYGYHANSRTIREPLRSRYSVRAFEMAVREPHVRQMVWYQLLGPPRSPERKWDTGLLGPNGHPRPILRALARWIRSAAKAGVLAEP
jgi:glycosyl hydrolase family 1